MTMPIAAPLPFVSHAVPAVAPRRSLRFATYALMVALTAGLLGGCAIWPKDWIFGSGETETPMEQPVAPEPTPPASACVAECEKKSEMAMATPVEPPRAEPQPIAPQMAEPPMPAPAMEPPKPAVLAPGYYINVGLFAVASNGSNAYNKLKAADLPAFTENVESNVGKLTRVRVGAYATRAKANAAAKKIRSLKLDAIVFLKK
jgi:cell division septation protein DedD